MLAFSDCCRRVVVLVIWYLFGLILLIVSVNDFLFFRIEDENVLCLLALYGISCLLGVSGSNFLFGLSVAVAVFVISWALNQFDLLGGGDVKLLFPLLLFAENNVSVFLIGTSIAGLLLSLMYIMFGRHIFLLRKRLINYLRASNKKNKNILFNIALLSLSRIPKKDPSLKQYAISALDQEIPYGVALACGGFYVIIESWLSRC